MQEFNENNLTEEQIEIIILAEKSKLTYFFSGVSLGSAITFFLIDFMIGQITPFSLDGMFMLMGSLGFYQWNGYQTNKLQELVSKETKKDKLAK